MRNRLINDATSLVKQPLGQSRYRMVVHRGAQYRQPAESATVNPYGGRTEAAAPDAERDEEEGNASRGVSAFFAGSLAGLLLSVGAETSRAIYTSRYLKRRNPVLHDKLQNLRDLDVLYFLVEDIVKPFETACMVGDKNPAEFNKYVNISLVDYEYKTNITHPVFPCYQRGWDGIRCFRYRAGWLVLFFLSK
ncbi:Uncharacterised protein [Klebsiella pneumoniae]|nr:Uncharacterised protein [Klebsiella pneumoniae]